MLSSRRRIVGAVVTVGIAAALAYWLLSGPSNLSLSQSRFYDAVAAERVDSVTIVSDGIGYRIRGTLRPEETTTGPPPIRNFTTYVLGRDLARTLRERGVSLTFEQPSDGSFLSIRGIWLPMLLLSAIFFFLVRRMKRQDGGMLSLGRSRAKLSSPAKKITFADVAGVEEAKQELQDIIEFLSEPDRFQRLGGRIPTGVLLMGPTGTGKTLLARAVAGEANVPFFSIAGSEFVEMVVGVGASRVRDLFEQGRKNAPCIVFIDELDAVGRQRGTGVGAGHDEREQTLNQLLVALDGFESRDQVIVLGATNRPDVLDPALLRRGRFDRQVVVDRPDVRGREEIISIHVQHVPLSSDVKLGLIARGTPGFSGADLASVVNEAALHAAGCGQETVTQDDLEEARDKVLMGSERRSLVMSDEERRATACHEAGHALVAYSLPEADPLHKVTIVPRGLALGTTQQIPAEDRHTTSRSHLLARICVLMGGRVAGQLLLEGPSSAAGEDFERTTNLARRMVTEWGMSEALGPLAYGRPRAQIFLGRDLERHRDYSEATAARIDREIKAIVVSCYEKARRILSEKAEALARIAGALLERETLSAGQIASLVRGEPLDETLETSANRRDRIEFARETDGVSPGTAETPTSHGSVAALGPHGVPSAC